MSLWDALRMNMMISYQELVRTFPKRDVLELKVPLEANNPSSPTWGLDKGMVQATIDALKENPDIAPADSVACQQAAIKQYRAGQKHYSKLR